MRTTEPAKWMKLLEEVSSLSDGFLKKYYEQKTFNFLGQRVSLSDKERFCTIDGLNRQLDEFSNRYGVVYYISETSNGMQKMPFEKTREDQYRSCSISGNAHPS